VKYVFADVETIRLAPGHLVVWEVGIITAHGEEYLWQVKPDLTIADQRALEVNRYHGRIDPALRDAQPGTALRMYHPSEPCADGVEPYDIGCASASPFELADEIENLARGAVFVGSKPTFDQDHLAVMLAEHGLTPAWEHHPLDLPSAARGWCSAKGIVPVSSRGDGKIRSDDWSRAIGVNPDAFERHTALGDCKWGAAQFAAMRLGEVAA
jgi:hypothetical protein